MSLECPTPESPWSAQPQSVPGVSSPRVFLECPTPVSSECPTPESPWSAQPHTLPGVPNPQSVQPSNLECPTSKCPPPPQSVPVILVRFLGFSWEKPHCVHIFIGYNSCRRISHSPPSVWGGVPNLKVSLECPTLVSLECPTPESPWSAQPETFLPTPGTP